MVDDILRKIRACLARAKSPGATKNEAETALRQARKLMELHGIAEDDVSASEISEHVVEIAIFGQPPAWTTLLGNLICKYFQVDVVWLVGYDYGPTFRKKSCSMFIGRNPMPEIAAYAFSVLYRQLKRDRAAYLKALNKRIKRVNRTTKSDAYAEGWVQAVAGKVRMLLRDMTDETRAAVTAYLERKHKNLNTFMPRSSNDRNGARGIDGDKMEGYRDGKHASLNHGVGNPGGKQNLIPGDV